MNLIYLEYFEHRSLKPYTHIYYTSIMKPKTCKFIYTVHQMMDVESNFSNFIPSPSVLKTVLSYITHLRYLSSVPSVIVNPNQFIIHVTHVIGLSK